MARVVLKCVLHVQHAYFLSFNQIQKKKIMKGKFSPKNIRPQQRTKKTNVHRPYQLFFFHVSYWPTVLLRTPITQMIFFNQVVTPGFKSFSYILLMYAWIEIALKKTPAYWSSMNFFFFFFWPGTLFRLPSQRWKLPSSYYCSSRAFLYICCQKRCKKEVQECTWRSLRYCGEC